jgi:hypothetical protein
MSTSNIVLGAPPKTFNRPITVKMLDGSDGKISILFKYRTQDEFAKLIDELIANGAATLGAVDDNDALQSHVAREIVLTKSLQVENILKIAQGWNLDQEFGRSTVEQLCNEYPGVANAIVNEYRLAVREGRSGN